VMTPVPFPKTPVRAALDPSVMEVGFAVKLVIEGGEGGVWVLDDPPPQPVKPARPRLRVMASGASTRRRFMGFPVSRSGRSQRPPRGMCGVTLPSTCTARTASKTLIVKERRQTFIATAPFTLGQCHHSM
jgi:hypothetical protein